MKRLSENLTSQYIAAANLLKPKSARKKIVAYVESYDDILFWRTLLDEFEDKEYYFQVMLPSSKTLVKGKKAALMNRLGKGLGQNMIACVDADYDYLLQGTTHTSHQIISSPYVFHTYAYAIENYQCYAESLHQVCVMATLNDRSIVDIPVFMQLYSRIIHPLFIWSVWFYRKHLLGKFSITDFNSVVHLSQVNLQCPEEALDTLSQRVKHKLNWLERHYPRARKEVTAMHKELQQLGVTPENTYLFVQGHHLVDNVIMKLLNPICTQLRRERESEIKQLAEHSTQMQNELTCYQHSQCPVELVLKKNTAYKDSPLYSRIKEDVKTFLERLKGTTAQSAATAPSQHVEECATYRTNLRLKGASARRG